MEGKRQDGKTVCVANTSNEQANQNEHTGEHMLAMMAMQLPARHVTHRHLLLALLRLPPVARLGRSVSRSDGDQITHDEAGMGVHDEVRPTALGQLLSGGGKGGQSEEMWGQRENERCGKENDRCGGGTLFNEVVRMMTCAGVRVGVCRRAKIDRKRPGVNEIGQHIKPIVICLSFIVNCLSLIINCLSPIANCLSLSLCVCILPGTCRQRLFERVAGAVRAPFPARRPACREHASEWSAAHESRNGRNTGCGNWEGEKEEGRKKEARSEVCTDRAGSEQATRENMAVGMLSSKKMWSKSRPSKRRMTKG